MANQIKVSVPRMKSDREQLQTELEKIPSYVQDLEASMKQLGTCWDGPAWLSFQSQVSSDILNMLDLYDWIRGYLERLSEAEKVYGECEKKGYEFVDKVRV